MIYQIKDIPDCISGVYKIAFPNGKIYIGISNNIKRRISEHNCSNKNYPICKAIRKYGRITEVEILEEILDRNKLYEREKYYINKFNSLVHQNGYNISLGGKGLSHGKYFKKGKYVPNYVSSVKNLLLEGLKSEKEIADMFNIKPETVSAINIGKHYYDKNLSYPLKKKKVSNSRLLTEEQITNIIYELSNYKRKMNDIAIAYNVSLSVIYKINRGEGCYQRLYINYPIRKKNENFKKFSDQEVIEILNLLKNTKLTQIEIANKYNCSRGLIGQINSGKKYYNERNDYPIRK